MKFFQSCLRILILSFPLLAASCTNDPDYGGKERRIEKIYGNFQVSLVEPTAVSQGFTSVLGVMYDDPTPSPLHWKETAKSGRCALLTPNAPFCEKPCGSGAACVADNMCRDYPNAVGAGKVSVNGIRIKDGAASFEMDPRNDSYQPPGGLQLAFPPFAEGDAVRFSAAGDTGAAAFSLSAKGIAPLQILDDSIVLAAGQAISLKWAPPSNTAYSTVSVMVDISHHGGTKGKIECAGPDNGAMEISASLADQLKALGVSGFPKIEIARRAIGTSAINNVYLVLESMVNRPLHIPGLVSCDDDEDCPDGRICQQDFQCK